jgi:NTE family protein
MKTNVALVLGSGGARGLAHIGVIEEFEKQGFFITSVSGTSIGSLVGGFYAMGRLPEFTDWMTTLRKKDVYNLMDFTLSTNGLLKAEKVFREMNSFIPDILIEEMNIPFSAVATDLINRKEVVFTKGSFYEAARASISIPTIITPVSAENRILVDGGLFNPVPVNRVVRTEGDMLVAVNLYDSKNPDITFNEEDVKNNSSEKKAFIYGSLLPATVNDIIKKIIEFIPGGNRQSQGYYTLVHFTTSVMLERISELSLQVNKPDILINIPASSAKTFDFHKAAQLIELGRTEAQKSINQYTGIHVN